MHQVSTTTSAIFTENDADRESSQYAMPRTVWSHSFLLDALFCLSAMHLAVLDPFGTVQWRHAALEYQQHSLHGFRDVLNHIDSVNGEAAFACSVAIMLGSLEMPELADEQHPHDPISDLLHVGQLLRGIGLVIKQAEDQIRAGCFGSLFKTSPVGSLQFVLFL